MTSSNRKMFHEKRPEIRRCREDEKEVESDYKPEPGGTNRM